jgi:hypothetical protein
MVRAGTPLALIGSVVDRKVGTVSFAVSIAHPKDSFNKHLARIMVRSHLQRRPFTIAIPNDATAYEINRIIMKAILSDEECDLFAMKLNRDQGLTEVAGYQNRKWVSRRFKHQGLRRLVSGWLAHPRIEKSDLMQLVKDALIKDPEIKSDPKAVFMVLTNTGFFNDAGITDAGKVDRFNLLHKLFAEETQVKSTG